MPRREAATERFVILAAPRTGSNLLCTLLNAHPDVLCHHEVFNPGGIYYALDCRDGTLDLGSQADRDRDPIAFLDRLWRAPLGRRCVGFKWTRGQDEQVLQTVLADAGVRKIVLRRRNRIKTFVSEKIAQRTGQWEVYRRADLVGERPPIRVARADLEAHIAENERLYSRLETVLVRSSQSPLEITYERLLDPAESRRLFAALGVETRVEARPASVKQNPTDLRQLVENFGELAHWLAGSELEAELHALGN